MSVRRLVFVLGDQLTPTISSLRGAEKARDVIVMAEVAEEASYAWHHRKKLAFVFAAMRHFAEQRRDAGWEVDYTSLSDDGPESLREAARRAVERRSPEQVVITEAGEHRLAADLAGWEEALGVPVEIREDDRFLCSHAEFDAWAEGRKELRMEWFYREMRRKHTLLMEGDDPVGGKWNLDQENRKPPREGLSPPERLGFEPDAATQDVLEMVADRFADGFGDLDGFRLAVTREDAEKAAAHFFEEALPKFGDYQDAMLTGERFMWHSLLSFYINAGLLDPLDLCRRAEERWREDDAPLNAVEGFVRQIAGWREYVRGVYWREGPGYVERNALGAERDLPGWWWSGETGMNCCAEVVRQTREEAYAHHIQRLMVTGNFALIAGLAPRQVHEWYLAVYADAYEWVEAPNVIGMILYADGGLLASKPYAASGAYIDRMSDYCAGCRYSPRKKTGEGACPFNLLYWDFLARNRKMLDGNRRLAMPYATWDRMDDAKKETIREESAAILDRLEEL